MERELSTLGDYLGVLRRRKLIVLTCVALAVGAGYAYAARQHKLYQASAEVAVAGVHTANPYGGTFGPSNATSAARALATQAALAHTPAMAAAAVKASGLASVTTPSLLASSTVTVNPNADVLTFAVESHSRADAVTLANAYAEQYILDYRARATATVAADRAQLVAQLRSLEREIENGSPSVASADRPQVDRDTQSLTDLDAFMSALHDATRVVSPAASAALVQPKPSRDIVIALFAGLVLGLLAAFIRDALDTRLRGSMELTAALGLPILGRIAPPPRRLRRGEGLAMLRGDRPGADAFRSLAVRISLAARVPRREAIMLTSAVDREGKSTTVANLGVALAEAGKRVVVVDLDLLRPSLAALFGLKRQLGLVEVIHGRLALADALQAIPVFAGRPAAPPGATGSLEVLPAGAVTEDPITVLGSPVLRDVLVALRGRADIVLLDTSPLLLGSSAMAISSFVDGLVLVARIDALHRRELAELQEVLAALPVPKLGLAVTGSGAEERSGDPDYTPAVLPDPLPDLGRAVASTPEMGRAV